MNQKRIIKTIGAAILTGSVSVVSMAGLAGDGVVVLQRDVPPHPAYRESPRGNAVQVDVSPDDKVRQGVQTKELSDSDFAAVNSGLPHGLGRSAVPGQSQALVDNGLAGNGANGGAGGAASSVQSIVPVVTGEIGPAVGAAGAGVTRAIGALNGLTGAVMRTSGQ